MDQLGSAVIYNDLNAGVQQVGSMTQMDIDKQIYLNNGSIVDNRLLSQVIQRQAGVFASQTDSPLPINSDTMLQKRNGPKSQRASKSTKNMFMQDAQMLRMSNQNSTRNVSADRIKMVDSMTIEGPQQQLLINQSQMMGFNGKSQPQLIIQDAIQFENHRVSNQSLKKRIPLKKSGGHSALGAT